MKEQINKVFDWGCIPGAQGPAVLACPKLAFLLFGILVVCIMISVFILSYLKSKKTRHNSQQPTQEKQLG